MIKQTLNVTSPLLISTQNTVALPLKAQDTQEFTFLQLIWHKNMQINCWKGCPRSPHYKPILCKEKEQGRIHVWSKSAPAPLLTDKSCKFSLFWGYISHLAPLLDLGPPFYISWIRPLRTASKKYKTILIHPVSLFALESPADFHLYM